MLEFFGSLGVIGWIVLILVILTVVNIRKILVLRSPLDSQDQKLWREKAGEIGGPTKPKHLESYKRK